MNDPGLDEPINNASSEVKDVVKPKETEGMGEEEEEKNFLMPARWWYASTAFPLLAGTFGPMANAFSICALVENWRVDVSVGGTEEHGGIIKDPKWLIAVNAVSLVCALIANMSLLLNMARRVPFKIAQPVTILGFWIASILLIALLAVANHGFHEPGVKNQALSQAYYYAIFAAGLYQLISYLMCVTVYGAYKGHYSKEFKLTVSQRTLMLQTIAFLVYQLLGALVYSRIEGWMFLDAVYWADFTLLTIGIGDDYTPKTHLGRGLLFPFAIGGIIILGLVVGSIRSLILDRGKKKMAARMTEKTREKLVKEVAKAQSRSHAKRKPALHLDKDTSKALTLEPGGDHGMSEMERRQAEFEAMRRVQAVAARKKQYMSLCTSSFAFAFLWTIGALVFFKAEKNQQWTYFGSLYFAYTSLLTIGYGDFQPISNSGKPFFVFWSLLAIPTLTILISNMGDTVIKSIKDATIWLGEVTVLPSDEGSVQERLRYGLYKATLGRVDPESRLKDEEAGSGSEDGNDEQELHPGLAKAFRSPRKKMRSRRKEKATGDRLASDFEKSEQLDETLAWQRGDDIEKDQHHYRATLISQIRKVHNDTQSSTPTKYSYKEWAYFLKLLGEDEGDSSFHKKAPTEAQKGDKRTKSSKTDAAEEQEAWKNAGQQGAHGLEEGHPEDGHDSQITPWSWIGDRSPLMGDMEEAEWVLEKLFQRLEKSLRESIEQKEQKVRHGAQDRYQPSTVYENSPSGHTTLDGDGVGVEKGDIGSS